MKSTSVTTLLLFTAHALISPWSFFLHTFSLSVCLFHSKQHAISFVGKLFRFFTECLFNFFESVPSLCFVHLIYLFIVWFVSFGRRRQTAKVFAYLFEWLKNCWHCCQQSHSLWWMLARQQLALFWIVRNVIRKQNVFRQFVNHRIPVRFSDDTRDELLSNTQNFVFFFSIHRYTASPQCFFGQAAFRYEARHRKCWEAVAKWLKPPAATTNDFEQTPESALWPVHV